MAATCPRCHAPRDQHTNFCPACGARLLGRPRPLRRSTTDVKLAGVCGGIAETFDLDATLVRAAYVVATVLSGVLLGLLLYPLLVLVIPRRDADGQRSGAS